METAGLPSYISYSINTDLISFTVAHSATMRAGDNSTIQIEGTLGAPSVPPSLVSLIGEKVASTFNLEVYGYDGSFKVENQTYILDAKSLKFSVTRIELTPVNQDI